MKIDGVFYTEPELTAKFRQMQETIQRLDGENHKLTEKLEEIGTAYNEQVSLAGWYEEREKEYKRLLKAAVEDFSKLDRENAKNKNCMMPEMDCADCPLSWDSVDDRVEPCHSWRYINEALDLIGEEP